MLAEVLHVAAGLGQGLAGWCLGVNIQAAVLLLAAMAADRAMAGRVSPARRVWLYAPVMIRALLPASALWAVPGWEAPRTASAVTVVYGWAELGGAPAAAGGAPAGEPWGAVLAAVYAAGVVLLAAVWARDAVRMRRVVAAARERGGGVLVSEGAGPLVAGLWRPRIVMPGWLEGSQELALVLSHERAHIARGDPLLAAGVRLVCVAAWPVAAVWMAGSRVRGLMEQACDERAVQELGGQEAVMKYARTMIEVAGRSGRGAVAGSLSFGASLSSRIAALRPGARWPRGVQAGLAAAIPAMMLACATAGPRSGAAAATATPAAGALTPAPAAPATKMGPNDRSITVQIYGGDIDLRPFSFSGTTPPYAVGKRKNLGEVFSRMDRGELLAAPRLLVNVGQEAAVTVGDGSRSLSLKLTVLPSGSEVKRVRVAYTEGDSSSDYSVPPTEFTIAKDEYLAVWVTAGIGLPPRMLVINVLTSEEQSEIEC